jgi:hypothetical protein
MVAVGLDEGEHASCGFDPRSSHPPRGEALLTSLAGQFISSVESSDSTWKITYTLRSVPVTLGDGL